MPKGIYPRKRKPLKDRLMAKVQHDDGGCWLWQGHVNNTGYAWINVDGKPRLGHRVSYEIFVGPIPDGLSLDHLCRVPRCVNPAHLEPVTHAENMRRGNSKFNKVWPKTTAASLAAREAKNALKCPNGHPREGNTVRTKEGWRQCVICKKANVARCIAKAKAKRAERRQAEALMHNRNGGPLGSALYTV